MTPGRLARRVYRARYDAMGRRRFRTDPVRRKLAKMRRDELRERGLCINGEDHGPATHGVLCWNCRQAHRKSS